MAKVGLVNGSWDSKRLSVKDVKVGHVLLGADVDKRPLRCPASEVARRLQRIPVLCSLLT